MGKILRQSIVLLALLTIVTGVVYPLVAMGIAQVLFPNAANGSLIERDGKVAGSELIGQAFSDPKYFWSRPSATTPFADNSAASTGSNLGPTNPALADTVKQRIEALRAADPGNMAAVPADLVTASASGLDPHISPAAAEYQVARVERVRGVPASDIRKLVAASTQGRTFGILGEARVNVLLLNLALDGRH
jgi:K+-transporting ATPase ATPase C chain